MDRQMWNSTIFQWKQQPSSAFNKATAFIKCLFLSIHFEEIAEWLSAYYTSTEHIDEIRLLLHSCEQCIAETIMQIFKHAKF